MEMQYFKSAWGDIKNSPGWFGKVCLLALLNFIPVFGQIVTFAYLYGWAREIAWGTHEPMPAKIFDNSDGKFWRRGWFALVLTFVFVLIPYIVMWLGNYWQGFGFSYSFFGRQSVSNPLLVGFGGVLYWVGLLGLVLLFALAWIGNMRVSIYDRLSSGFQFNKIWKMLRHDTSGFLKIFGMGLLFWFIFGIILTVVFFILAGIVVSAGVAALVNSGLFVSSTQIQYMLQTQPMQVLVQFFVAAGVVGFFAFLVITYLVFLARVFVRMLVIRAMGYWTMQFDVSHWGGQDDPMPFELFAEKQARQQAQAAARSQAQPQQPVQAAAPVPVPVSAASAEPEDEMPEIDYGEPMEVGAGFILSPEEIAEAEAAAVNDVEPSAEPAVQPAVAPEGFTFDYEAVSGADAQGAHGVQDGQAGDAHVGEDGEPHGGDAENGQA